MFNFFNKKNRNNIITTNFKKKSHTARCPKCNNLLTENNDYLCCVDTLSGVCDFKIDRNINGKKISLEMFADFQSIPNVINVYNIVNSERDRMIQYYKDMYADMQERYIKKDIFFKGARRLKGHCPNHFNPTLFRKGNIVKCGECDFTINTVFRGVNFSDDDIKKMLDRTISNEHIFIDDDGSSIKTTAFLDFDKKGNRNGEFELVRDISEMEEHHLQFVHIYPEDSKSRMDWIRLEEYLIKNDVFFKDAKEIDFKCPNHLTSDVKLYKKGDTIRCNKCRFEMNTSFNGVNFSNNELKHMLAKTISNEHVFVDENGKSIKTVAFIDFDKKGNYSGDFKLATDPSKMEEHHLKFVYIYPEGIKNRMKWIRLEEYLNKQKK